MDTFDIREARRALVTMPAIERVELWVKALETPVSQGGYRQARRHLRQGDSFCCLGVLSDLSGLGHWEDNAYSINGWRTHSVLPPEVALFAGVASPNGCFVPSSLPADLQAELRAYVPLDDSYTLLSHLNDNGVPFPLIARVIRARPYGLFMRMPGLFAHSPPDY